MYSVLGVPNIRLFSLHKYTYHKILLEKYTSLHIYRLTDQKQYSEVSGLLSNCARKGRIVPIRLDLPMAYSYHSDCILLRMLLVQLINSFNLLTAKIYFYNKLIQLMLAQLVGTM